MNEAERWTSLRIKEQIRSPWLWIDDFKSTLLWSMRNGRHLYWTRTYWIYLLKYIPTYRAFRERYIGKFYLSWKCLRLLDTIHSWLQFQNFASQTSSHSKICVIIIENREFNLQEHTVPHLKDLIHICLENESQGHGMTFNMIYDRSKYPHFISYRGLC